MEKRILRRADVVKKTGLSPVTLWRLEKAGLFPNRKQLGARAVGWVEDEVDGWIESREAAAVNG